MTCKTCDEKDIRRAKARKELDTVFNELCYIVGFALGGFLLIAGGSVDAGSTLCGLMGCFLVIVGLNGLNELGRKK